MSHFEEENYKSILFRKVLITLYIIIFILGIIGNGLVIWIAGFRMKKTVNAVWFLNLAITDFLCCLSLPFSIVEEAEFIVQKTYSQGVIHCILSIIMFYTNMSASIFLLMAMSIDRWVSVMWPFWAKVNRTQKLVRITAGIIWVMSLLMTCLVFHFRGWCVYYYPYIDNSSIFNIRIWVELFILFVIPFFIIVTSYVTIFLKLRKSKRPPRSQRPYRIITAVILCFFICWAPHYIYPLIPMYGGDDFLTTVIIYFIDTILPYLNSCINPIIYVFMGQDFRHVFLRSIPFRVEKALADHPDDSSREQDNTQHIPITDLTHSC